MYSGSFWRSGNGESDAGTDFKPVLGQAAKVIFMRRYWYGESVAEIAGQFEISESKVKSSLFRTRNLLKCYLQREGFEE